MNSENRSPLENAMRRNAPKRLAARVLRELLEGRATRAALVIMVLSIATFICASRTDELVMRTDGASTMTDAPMIVMLIDPPTHHLVGNHA